MCGFLSEGMTSHPKSQVVSREGRLICRHDVYTEDEAEINKSVIKSTPLPYPHLLFDPDRVALGQVFAGICTELALIPGIVEKI